MRRRFYTNKKNILPLYIEAKEDGVCFSSLNTAISIYYQIDMGDWLALEPAAYSQSISKGQRLYIKSNTPFTFLITGRCKIGGDIRSIKYGDNYKIFNGGNYSRAFANCTTIEEVEPNLLQYVTDLSDYCYDGMFEGCTSLTTAPELPVTILTSYCYRNMFNGCSKLNYIKMLATDISASSCLSYWVYGVASTGTFVKNPAMNSLPTGDSGIPSGWTVVNDGDKNIDNFVSIEPSGTRYNIIFEYPCDVPLKVYLRNWDTLSVSVPAGTSSHTLVRAPITPYIIDVEPQSDSIYNYTW